MALFMDMHSIDGGMSASDAAAAHEADLATQAAYGVNYLRYWVDEEAGRSSASSMRLMQGQRTPSTARLTGSSLTRSTRSANSPRRRDR
jgi:Protein of unknown function (DUF4242)